MIRSARTVYRHPILGLLIVLLLLALTGCGVVHAHLHHEDRLVSRLSIPMTKEQVLRVMGTPYHEGLVTEEITQWEYRLYSGAQVAGKTLSCLGALYLPTLINCLFPNLPHFRIPYWVVFRSDWLCLWGSPDDARTRSTCMATTPSAGASQEHPEPKHRVPAVVSVDPVALPQPIQTRVHRMAIVPQSDPVGHELPAWLDQTLALVRRQHPGLALVEGDALPPIPDVLRKYRGLFDVEGDLARYGRLAGVDTVLAYHISRRGAKSSEGKGVQGSVEIRVVKVEKEDVEGGRSGGTTVFHEVVRASTLRVATAGDPLPLQPGINFAHRVAVEHATAYALAALVAALGGNTLGVVPDLRQTVGGLTVMGALHGSPAAASELQAGDKLITLNGRPFTWTDAVVLPATLTTERAGVRKDVALQ